MLVYIPICPVYHYCSYWTYMFTYVTDSRIEMAKRMLVDTEMPVINIAYELSYNETNYFSKAFKKKVGVTPSEYRTAHSELFREQGAG